MEPPRPPSPPSGPPRGTCGSCREVAAPSPPSPARTQIFTRSRNIAVILARTAEGSAGATSLEVAQRVDAGAAVPDRAAPHLEVEVRARGVAGLADATDLLAAVDVLPTRHRDRRHVVVRGVQVGAVGDPDL